jgi:hypothetical protein
MKAVFAALFAGMIGCAFVKPVSAADAVTYKEKVLYSFCSQTNCTDGAHPTAGLIDVNGILYGTTQGAGGSKDSAASLSVVWALQCLALSRNKSGTKRPCARSVKKVLPAQETLRWSNRLVRIRVVVRKQHRRVFAKFRAPRIHNSEFISEYQRIAANARAAGVRASVSRPPTIWAARCASRFHRCRTPPSRPEDRTSGRG